MTDATGGRAASTGPGGPVPVSGAAGLVAALLAPGPLVGQAACDTLQGPTLDEWRESHREVKELRDSIEAILDREDDLDSVGKVVVATDPDEMETDVGFVDFDPPERAVYRIRGLLAKHLAGTPPEERNLRVDLEAPPVTVEGDRVESCDPFATNDDHIEELLADVAGTYRERTEGGLPDGRLRGVLWLFVDWRGEVTDVRVRESSGDAWLDEAFAATAREMEFDPGTIGGTPTGLWVARELTIEVR